jgi:tetratricopeptide (TPR) repeat protein
VIRAGARAAAVALAVAALSPGPARPDALADAEEGAPRAEELLRSVEEVVRRPEDDRGDRAQQRFSNGETQYLLGDWAHAALLLGDALDDPSFREGPQAATATFYVGDALRQSGSCGAARSYLDAYLAGGELAHRGEALGAALDCAVRTGHRERIAPLLAEADAYYKGQLPTELRYLSAKATFARTELPPDERFTLADAAFAAVGPPFAQQAGYHRAVLRIQRNDLAGAAELFAGCAGLPAADARQRDAQDLCTLGLARVRAELGDLPGAIAAYDQVPIDSPSFDESLYEVASVQGRAGQLEPALRAAETLIDVSPDSPLASRSLLLQGQLRLAQGKYELASQLYGRVIDDSGRVRDELDAVLTLHQDPIRFLADLLSQRGPPSQVASPLPQAAVRAALARPELARASSLMQTLDAEVRALDETRAVSARISAVLSRGDGIDAFPRLREGYAGVQAVENAVAVLQGAAATAAVEAAGPSLPPDAHVELIRVHAERLVLEEQLQAFPRTLEAARARRDRRLARVDELDRRIFQLGYAVEAARAAIAGAEVWLSTRGAEVQGGREQRDAFRAELRTHREVVDEYERELAALRREVARTRDAAGGEEVLDEEARLRADHLELLARERRLLDGARGRLAGGAAARFERAAAVGDRLGEVGARARDLAGRISAEARRQAQGLRAQLAADQADLVQQSAALDAVRAEARRAIGRVAYRSFGAVRDELYALVLRADVGLNDVVWGRKRDRVKRIQQLSMQQSAELEALDAKYRPLLQEEQ